MELVTVLPKIFWSRGRLETYTNWPYKGEDDICTPERMAAAGFYVVGGEEEEDVVECFICGKQLDGWDASDNPWEEHAKHQPDCRFVLLSKQDELQWSIEDLLKLTIVYYSKEFTRQMEHVVKNMKLESQLMAKQIPKIYRAERGRRKGGK